MPESSRLGSKTHGLIMSAMMIALIGVSMPIFWLGIMEQYLVCDSMGLASNNGRDNIRDPVEAITGFYLIDTLVSGRFDQLLKW